MQYRRCLLGATALAVTLTAGVGLAPASATSASPPAASGTREHRAVVPDLPEIPGSSTLLITVNGEFDPGYGQEYPLWDVADDDDDINNDVPIELDVRNSHAGTLTVVEHGDPFDPSDDTVVAEKRVEAGRTTVSFAVPDSNRDYTVYVVTDDGERTRPQWFSLAVGGADVRDVAGVYSDLEGSADKRITVTGKTYANERVEVDAADGERYFTRALDDGTFGITYYGEPTATNVVVEHNGWTNNAQEVPFEHVEPGEGDPSLVWPIVDLGDLRSFFGIFAADDQGQYPYLSSASGTGLQWRAAPEDVAGNSAVGWSIPKVDASGPIILEGNTCITAGADGALRSDTCVRTDAGDPSQTFTATLRDGHTLLRLTADPEKYLTLADDGSVRLGAEADAAVLAYEELYESSWSVADPKPSVADRSVQLSGTAIPGALVTVDGTPVTTNAPTGVRSRGAARLESGAGSWSTTVRDLPVGVERTFEIQQLIDGVVVAQSEQRVLLDPDAIADVTSSFPEDVRQSAQVHGTAQPGATIQLLDGGVPVDGATTTADTDGATPGAFTLDVPAPNAAGEHVFTLTQVLDDTPVGTPTPVTIDYGAGVTITGTE